MSSVSIGDAAGLPASDVGTDVDKTAFPMLLSERNWGAWRLFFSLSTVAAATWCYIIGEYVGYYLGFWQSLAVLVGGSMIGIMLVILALMPTTIRFGIDSIAASKPQFGTRGWIIPFALQYLSIFGWNSLLLIFFGRSFSQFLVAVGALPAGDHIVVSSIATLVACSFSFAVLLKGARGVDKVAQILVVHVLVGFWMLYLIVTQRWDALMSATPQYAAADAHWNYTTGIELAIAPALSWWPYFGAMVRMTSSARKGTMPAMLGFGLVVGLLSMIGAAGILAIQISDPAQWMSTVGGPTYAAVSLAFVTAANLGTAIAGIYASAIGLRHYKALEKARWPWLLLIAVGPVAVIGMVAPTLFFNNFGTFLAFIGITFSPICGIQIADYWILRRGKISIRAIYDNSPEGAYRFFGGFNPAAIVALAAGVGIYLSLLNPLTYVSAFPYEFTTASLPACFGAGLVYVLVTLLVVKRSGKGGYAA